MELNGYHSPIGTIPTGSPTTFYIEATIEQAAALNNQTLTMTHGGKIVAIYPDYTITSIVQEKENLVAVTAQRVLEPALQQTLERLDFSQSNQETINQSITTQLNEQAAALIDLANLISDSVEPTDDDATSGNIEES